jgi:hypothetical protein
MPDELSRHLQLVKEIHLSYFERIIGRIQEINFEIYA